MLSILKKIEKSVPLTLSTSTGQGGGGEQEKGRGVEAGTVAEPVAGGGGWGRIRRIF